MLLRKMSRRIFCISLFFGAGLVQAEDSRILATGGVSQIEGAAGGGIVPWAVIAGYAQQDEFGFTASGTTVNTDDFQLDVLAIAFGFDNQYEFSIATQTLNLGPLQANLGLPSNELKQTVYGGKYKLFGDIIYGDLPQISLGFQYKKVDDFTIPNAVGAVDSDGVDVYLAASKLWLEGFGGYPILTNVTLRSSSANQLGLLGFGGDKQSAESLLWEINASLFIRRNLVLGYEYRQKPDNLNFAVEEDWQDIYLAWFFDKSIAATVAWTNLGSIAGLDGQKGLYLSLQATF